MIRNCLAITVSAFALVACAATPPAAPVEVAVVDAPAQLSKFDLAMQTADELVVTGYEQVAISRLEQLLGSPELTREERAEALVRMGEIKMSDRGFDTWGAIENLEEAVDDYGDTEWLDAATTIRDEARGKATSYNFMLEQPETSRSQKFDLLMELGEHDRARDLMTAYNLMPSNAQLVAMYQIGYLCEGDTLTGQEYELVEPDGSERAVRFCDLGK